MLIVTGPKEELASSIDVDDEDYTRERGGDYGVLDRLRRVDIRYIHSFQSSGYLMIDTARQLDMLCSSSRSSRNQMRKMHRRI